MYKLILVDDEEEVRKGILERVDWEKFGFEIAGEAENGIEALEIAERTKPDVVVTDIKMPFMNGIELSEQIRKRFPTAKIIILTGFDDFEFAQKAIKLRVSEYILKPVSYSELSDALTKIRVSIDEEIAQRKDIEGLRSNYAKNLPVLREMFLGYLLTNRVKPEEIEEKAGSYGLDFTGGMPAVSVIGPDINSAPIPGNSLTSYENRELLKFAVLNITQEIIDKNKLGLVFLHNDLIVLISFFSGKGMEATLESISAVLEEIRYCVEKYLGFTVTIGLGSFCKEISDICSSYKNALTALDYRLVYGCNRVIYIEDVEPRHFKGITLDPMKEAYFIGAIKVGTENELRALLDELFFVVAECNISVKDCQIYLLQILTAILKAAKDLGVDMESLFGKSSNFFEELYTFHDLNEIKSWVYDICKCIRDSISKERRDSNRKIVAEAKEYIRKNYCQSDLSIDKICRHLHISPTYFSTIFKKDTRLTIVNYLTQVRMEAAKELLAGTDLRNFEIAEKIGYSEPNYFSYSFKKNFGISPTQYKNSIK